MNQLLSVELADRLCLVLLHSLWQCALLASVAVAASRWLHRGRVEAAYRWHAAALVGCLALVPVTFWALPYPQPEKPAMQMWREKVIQPNGESKWPMGLIPTTSETHAKPQATPVLIEPIPIPVVMTNNYWRAAAPYIAALYLLGVAVMFARLLRGLVATDRLRRTAHPIPNSPTGIALRDLALRWRMKTVPLLAETSRTITPTVVGFTKPLILLPTATLTGLSPQELELILAHELAHLRRGDLWLQLVQRLAEAVLFYNPALWYLTRRVSTLREECCDTAACGLAGPETADVRLTYATALVRVVELVKPNLAAQATSFSLAATGRGPSELRRRIARLVGEPVREPVRVSWGAIGLMVTLVALFIGTPSLVPTAAGEIENAVVEKDQEHELKIIVVDTKGVPISGAKVFQNHIHIPPDAPATGKRTEIKNHDYFTDDEGAAVVIWSGESVDLRLWVEKPNYVPLHAMWARDFQTDGDQIPAEFTFVLKAGTTIGGNVQDEDGQPVAGAKVDVSNVVSTFYNVMLAQPRKPPNRPVPVRDLAEVTTDAQGRWQATNIPPDGDLAIPAIKKENIFLSPLNFDPPLQLKVSHPDFETFGETKSASSDWGAGTSEVVTPPTPPLVNPTLEELRSGKAVVVLKKRKAPEAEKTASDSPTETTPTSARPNYVIAEHVILREGKEIVTWEVIREQLKAIKEQQPDVKPQFRFTHGAINAKLFDPLQQHINVIRRELNLSGHSVGSMSPGDSRRFDEIRKAADLAPDESLGVSGIVVDRDGKPIAGAAVLLVTQVDESLSYKSRDIAIIKGRVRNELDNVMTYSSDIGEFTLYPPKDVKGYFVALHPTAGFGLSRLENFDTSKKLNLLEWAGVNCQLPEGIEPRQDIGLSTRIAASDEYPEINISQHWSDRSANRVSVYEYAQVPPIFETTIARNFPYPDGSGSTSLAEMSIGLIPGEVREIKLGAPTPKQLEHLDEIRKKFGELNPTAADGTSAQPHK